MGRIQRMGCCSGVDKIESVRAERRQVGRLVSWSRVIVLTRAPENTKDEKGPTIKACEVGTLVQITPEDSGDYLLVFLILIDVF